STISMVADFSLLLCDHFLLYCFRAHRHLHSFPTRRSSDLIELPAVGPAISVPGHPRTQPTAGTTSRRARANSLPFRVPAIGCVRSEEHTSELQSRENLVCRLLLEKKKKRNIYLL